jgi:putative flippase GtrA
LAQLVRFAVVGGFSTGVFMVGQYLLIGVLGQATMAATTISLLVSLLASYAGHHAVTFRRTGAHLYYGSRFVIVSAIMLIVSDLVLYGLVDAAGLSYIEASVAISILYPIGSFFLLTLWVFPAPPRRD